MLRDRSCPPFLSPPADEPSVHGPLVFPYFFRSSNFEYPARIKKTKKLAGYSSARPPALIYVRVPLLLGGGYLPVGVDAVVHIDCCFLFGGFDGRGAVVLGDALHQTSLVMRTMVKDGTAMAVVDCPREMSEGATAVSHVKNQFFSRKRDKYAPPPSAALIYGFSGEKQNIKFYFQTNIARVKIVP
jgi:hypothetical protein